MYAIRLRNGHLIKGFTLIGAAKLYVNHGVVVAVVRIENNKVVVQK